ncbi:hypothetical protein [Streptomyces narbonensis]|uniref:hypothetical protein n=1 Tax=Streptomyces narbonensis TaxID=67333 RepID=UPI0034087817
MLLVPRLEVGAGGVALAGGGEFGDVAAHMPHMPHIAVPLGPEEKPQAPGAT